MSKEFRKAIRVLVNQLHKKKKASAKADKQDDEQEQATLAVLSPEVKAFVQDFTEEWHTKLSQKPPRLVAKKMKKERSLPQGLGKDDFQWLCRFMARWHRKHAGKCDVMSGWSSGETGDDTSGDEDASPRRRGKHGRVAKLGESGGLSESEDTDCLEKVSNYCVLSVILINVVTLESNRLTQSRTQSASTNSLIRPSLAHSPLTHGLTHPRAHASIHSLTHSPTGSIVLPRTHWRPNVSVHPLSYPLDH